MVKNGKIDCVTKVIRCKNGFKNLNGDLDVNSYDYSDIKLNVKIEYNRMSIIGEIQFLTKFMLISKKMGYRFYSFCRKHEFYQNLNNLNKQTNDLEIILKLLQTQMLSKNKNVFSKIMQSLYKNEIENIKQSKEKQQFILKKLKRNNWKKGIQIFQSMIE